MYYLSLLAQKGGAGKTTLAVHLAVMAAMRGENVVVIDTDPQFSAAQWWRARKLKRPAMAQCHPKNLSAALAQAEKRGFTLAVIDTAPRADRAAIQTAELVDFNLIPCRPGPMDLRAIGKTVDLVENLGAPAGIVINAAPPPRGNTEVPFTRQARRALSRYNLPLAPFAITQRPTLQHPMPDGRTYIEQYPEGRPAREIAALLRWVKSYLGDEEPSPAPAPRAAQPRRTTG
ncbi:MAG: ParA family protein, partial [Proteobacteria bacterium]|nr:ParA family protein [Pseudomonadota bacterium]